MTIKYPWYEVVEGGRLMQGDILLNCPVVVATNLDAVEGGGEDLEVEIERYDVVVMTQSCDLENDKVQDVLISPNWDIDKNSGLDEALFKKGALREIQQNRRPRYMLLQKETTLSVAMNVRIVDLGRVFTIPKALLSRIAEKQGARLRLCPPYREHLSQSYGRFIMRVGLPSAVDLPAGP